MIALHVELEGDGCWPDLAGKAVVEGQMSSVALLRGGMEGGAHSVSFRIEMPDGSVVFAQQSWTNIAAALEAMKVRVQMDRNRN